MNSSVELLACTSKNTPYFTFKGQSHICKCVSVYDGDTITVVFDTGIVNGDVGPYYKHRIRLLGIDTPELRTKNLEEKKMGIKVRDFVREKILNKLIRIECAEFDKYGRLLANVFIGDENINKLLVDMKYAYKYLGGTKQDIYVNLKAVEPIKPLLII
jgi:endonuclease YncB( thermonuclease family)